MTRFPAALILAIAIAVAVPVGTGAAQRGNKPHKPRTGRTESDAHDNESHKGATPIVDTWTPIHTGDRNLIDGGAGLTLRSNGKWQFTGHFYNNSGLVNRVGKVFGVESHGADGALFLFEAMGVTSFCGSQTYAWNKSRTSKAIKDHWSDLAKGHAWHGCVNYAEAVQNPVNLGNLSQAITFTLPPLSIAGPVNLVEMRLKAVGPVTAICK